MLPKFYAPTEIRINQRVNTDILARSVDTADVQGKIEHICRVYAAGSFLPQLREYVMTDYLLLYVLGTDAIDLLAVKHHKQLSFDIHI